MADSSSDDESTVSSYTIHDRDRDLSRGMGHHLRVPVPVSPSGSQRRRSLTTSDAPTVLQEPAVVSVVHDVSASRISQSQLPEPSTRVLRPRRTGPSALASPPPAKIPRVPAGKRWYYEPLPPDIPNQLHEEVAAFVGTLSSSLPSHPIPLQPRQSWMRDGDDRSDVEADLDSHHATQPLLPATHSRSGTTKFFTPSIPQLSDFYNAASTMDPLPTTSFDVASAFQVSSDDAPPIAPFPQHLAPHLCSKVVRRILAARESIFKYGIYLPRNDRDADASPERARWHSGRQLEWIRLKEVMIRIHQLSDLSRFVFSTFTLWRWRGKFVSLTFHKHSSSRQWTTTSSFILSEAIRNSQARF